MSQLIPDSIAVDERDPGGVPWFVRLWAAVVRRAAVDWVLYKDHESTKHRKLGSDAAAWIFSDEESDRLSSFSCVCDILGLDKSLLRQKIRSMTEEQARCLRGMEFGDDW